MDRVKGILLNEKDNVATVLGDAKAGDLVQYTSVSGSKETKLTEEVPYGFKFSISAIAKGEEVIKYGEVIGLATKDIALGEMVHVHNLEGQRARGDLVSG